MKNFVEAVEKAIEAKNFYGALFIALTLPDICGKIEFPKMPSSKRYIKWFDKYMSDKYSSEGTIFLSGEDCYALRCSFLHEGKDDITEQKARGILEEFMFMTEGPHCNLSQNNYVNGKRTKTFLQLRVDRFCSDICVAVKQWLKDVSSNKKIMEELNNTIKIYKPGSIKGGIKFG